MGRNRMLLRPMTTTLLAGALLLLAGCGDAGGDAEQAAAAGTEEAAAEATDETSGGGEEAPEQAEEAPAEAEEAGEEFATATWMGEGLEFHGVTCGGLPQPDMYEIRARGEGYYVQARFEVDMEATESRDDPVLLDNAPSMDLFFDGDNGTIGDGEGYRGFDEGLDWSAGHVSGTLEMSPDSSTRADEVNPDGGTLEFEIRC